MRRMFTGGVSAVAVLSLALAGCSGADTAAPAKRPAQKVDVATLLPQSLQKIQNESFKFSATITMNEVEIKTSGAFDMSRKLGTVTMEMAGGTSKTMTLEMRIIGDEMYMSGLMSKDQWTRVDLSKFSAGNMIGEAANPVSNADYLLAIADAKEVGKGRYQGTLDLEKFLKEHAKPEEARKLREAVGKLGPDAMKVPFEATVDDQNRLSTMKITMTLESEGEKITMVQDAKYFDFGTKVEVAKPPADKVTDAPAGIYKN